MMFHLMFAHYTFSSVWLLSGYLLGNSCPLDWSCFLIFSIGHVFSFYLFPILVIRAVLGF